jgi:hypothetical protein
VVRQPCRLLSIILNKEIPAEMTSGGSRQEIVSRLGDETLSLVLRDQDSQTSTNLPLSHQRRLDNRNDGLRATGEAPQLEGVQVFRRRPLAAIAICSQAILYPRRYKMFSHVDGT